MYAHSHSHGQDIEQYYIPMAMAWNSATCPRPWRGTELYVHGHGQGVEQCHMPTAMVSQDVEQCRMPTAMTMAWNGAVCQLLEPGCGATAHDYPSLSSSLRCPCTSVPWEERGINQTDGSLPQFISDDATAGKIGSHIGAVQKLTNLALILLFTVLRSEKPLDHSRAWHLCEPA